MAFSVPRVNFYAIASVGTRGSQMQEPIDIIRAAIHSAFVKYPKEDDPASHDQWIQPADSVHLAKAVMLELEANGFEIVKKGT
jgi:hypothetical protein